MKFIWNAFSSCDIFDVITHWTEWCNSTRSVCRINKHYCQRSMQNGNSTMWKNVKSLWKSKWNVWHFPPHTVYAVESPTTATLYLAVHEQYFDTAFLWKWTAHHFSAASGTTVLTVLPSSGRGLEYYWRVIFMNGWQHTIHILYGPCDYKWMYVYMRFLISYYVPHLTHFHRTTYKDVAHWAL
jgi:hypothetical protein